MIRKALSLAPSLLAALLLACTLGTAAAQVPATPNETPLGKQIDRLDLAVMGAGQYNSTVTGPILSKTAPDCDPAPSGDCQTIVTQFGSNTFGALATLRYVARPYVGLEFNYGFARYTENFNVAPLQIQTKATEYSFGYVVTPPHTFFGFQPFASAGVGTLEFTPTPFGGQGAPKQARMVYYYSAGLQQDFESGHFGLRAGFREAFFLDPDFGQNYLTILKHATTYEPIAGFYLRY